MNKNTLRGKTLAFGVSAASIVSVSALSGGCSSSCLSCFSCLAALIPLAIPAALSVVSPRPESKARISKGLKD